MAEAAAPVLNTEASTAAHRGVSDDVLSVFTVLWALAALFHVLGPSGRAFGVVHDVTFVGLSHVAVGVAAVAVLAMPRRTAALVVLAVLSPVSAWLEAPVLGNHWIVAAFVDLGIVGAAIAARRGRSIDRERLADVVVPIARWTLVVFYSFAAIAKLNHGFFDTTVGCGTYYFDELAGSLGFSTPIAVGHGGWAHFVPVGVAATELSVPLLLLWRRTRNAGVAVGLVFHSVIALDQTHLFSDFSSVLAALFVLFLPSRWASEVVDTVRQRAREASFAQLAAVGAFSVALVLQWRSANIDRAVSDLRMWLWLAADGLLLVAVFSFLARRPRDTAAHPLSLRTVPRWLLFVPVIVVLNGFTPYVEMKTAYGYTMYSNLTTADGSTNSLIVPRTFPINGNAADVVRIERTNDPGLQEYVTLGYDLPYLSLRAYLADHPTAAIRYIREGVVHDLAHASEEPDLVRPVSDLERKLFALRAVDQQDPPRCQEFFLPAL